MRAVLDLLRSGVPVHGLAHITGGGLTNLLRLAPARSASRSSAPLPVPGIFDLIARLGAVPAAEMWEVFNMGCGFVAVVPEAHADEAAAILGAPAPRQRADRHGQRPPGRDARPRRRRRRLSAAPGHPAGRLTAGVHDPP